jgi:hypothetical protein
MTPERKAELENVIQRMRTVSNAFYYSAVHVGNHAFIEFCGLMNEYIQVCALTLEGGHDYTETTGHGSGAGLRMEDFHRAYIAEKLECIFSTSFPALMTGTPDGPPQSKQAMRRTIAELRAEVKEDERLRSRLSSILTHTANALKGPPATLTSHDWSDLPKVAAAMRELATVTWAPGDTKEKKIP